MGAASLSLLVDRMDQAMRRWVEAHPRLTGWTLVMAALGVALFVVGAFATVVLFAWGVAPQAGPILGTLTLALWGGVILLVRLLRSPDQRYSRRWLRLLAKAEAGDVAARWAVVASYRREPVHAAHWLRLLAEGGEARAAYELALLLDRGDGLLRDRPGARRWMVQAAEAGHGPAQVWLRGNPLAEG